MNQPPPRSPNENDPDLQWVETISAERGILPAWYIALDAEVAVVRESMTAQLLATPEFPRERLGDALALCEMSFRRKRHEQAKAMLARLRH